MFVFTPPPSKSITNRALVLASLAKGKSIINNIAECDDSKYMIRALRKLGIKIIIKNNSAIVFGNGGNFEKNNLKLFCGNAGTTFRFLLGLCALNKGKITLYGSKRMRERPIEPLVKSLKELGADVKSSNGFPPIFINGGNLKVKNISIDGSISSQFISSLLMIAPALKENIVIKVNGHLSSKPFVNLTIDLMKRFGVEVENQSYSKFIIQKGQHYIPTSLKIESDAASASYFIASAIVLGNSIRINGLGKNSLQPDLLFIDIVKQFGCRVKKKADSIDVIGDNFIYQTTKDISIDLNSAPDIVPTIAILSLFRKGKTKIYNVKNLRYKESDRLSALANELRKVGAKVNELEDSLEIYPNKLKS
ncbi:MAG: 3-phosphoshikimate 1-carboxyvinyltransferase, partial [Ignavibacteria bacterium]|nr:3-phosphoshikimate 1-carboxyvinyltransferase [Ignavibacteria bacterium]